MGASIEDVARRAGVSTATVSRSLRGLPNVSDQTRARVLRAARDLDYVASPSAVSLASGRTSTVGVVVPYITKWFFAQVVAGAEPVLREAGLDLLLYNLGDAGGRARFFRGLPLRKRVDALLVLSVPLTAQEITRIVRLGIPIAVVGADVPGVVCVRIDDVGGARHAVEHLLGLGHRRVGMVLGDPGEPMRFSVPVHRLAGYRAALADAGLAPGPELRSSAPSCVDGGERAARALLRLDHPPTAVFAECDEMAFGVLRAARRMGVEVPHDLSVVGFDGQEMGDLLDLTTVEQPVARQGELAARALLDALGGSTPAAEHIVLPTRLIERGSTGRPATDSRRRRRQMPPTTRSETHRFPLPATGGPNA